jgi:hypothetical protein
MAKKPTNRTGKAIRQRAKSAQPAQVHELKITLHGSKPPIWRRIAVPSNMRLSDLHEVIQTVCGWTNSHLHQFVVRYPRPKPAHGEIAALVQSGRWEKLAEYMCRDRCLSDPRMEIEETEDENKVVLSELAPAVKSKFIYEYDFGDGWDHQIEVVKIGPPAEGMNYPVCLKGKLACPPEDCGGIWGYYEMLEALEDPKHERHGEFVEWIGGEFDPEQFDLDEINAELSELRSGKSRRLWDPYGM